MIASGGVPAWMTCGPSPPSPTAGWKAPSSERPCTPDDSRCQRRWPRWGSRAAMALDEADLDALVAAGRRDSGRRGQAVHRRAPRRISRAEEGQRLRHRGRPGHRAPGRRGAVSATGIEVHGEEFGGADVDSPLVWVLDPIDGTFNYAAGSPMAAILLGLVRDGEPVAGLTWVPFTGERFTGIVGKPLRSNGVEQPPLKAARVGRLDRRGQHVQRRLAGQGAGSLPAGGDREPEPEVLADADARCDGHRPRLHRGRNPRWGNQFQCSSVGSRGGRRVGAGGRRHRHRPGRQRLDHQVALGAGRTARRARELLDILRVVGDPEDY